MTRRLIFVRHGQTAQNAQGRYVSEQDVDLDEVGVRQVDSLASHLGGHQIDLIVTSPRLRCDRTAVALRDGQRDTPDFRYDDRLLELGMGSFEGMSAEEIERAGLAEVFDRWRQGTPVEYPDGAETFEAAALRVGPVFDELAADDYGNVVLVGHSHALRILIATAVLGGSPEMHRRLFIDHASLSWVEWERGAPRLIALNRLQFVPPAPSMSR